MEMSAYILYLSIEAEYMEAEEVTDLSLSAAMALRTVNSSVVVPKCCEHISRALAKTGDFKVQFPKNSGSWGPGI